MTTNVRAFAAVSPKEAFAPINIERRDVGPKDVGIEILYCGVCHSDLHTARSEWPGTVYPVVPGHEIVGRVVEVGNLVTAHKKGDVVGVGCLVDSCRTCASCGEFAEQYCDTGGMVFTYNSPDVHLPGKTTYGGYSAGIVVDERFVLRIPAHLDPAAAAPLLCAGITTYSPLRHWGVGKGSKVGIVGLGGLGHMGVKLSVALGAQTVLFTTSQGKVADGLRLGAAEVVISKDDAAMARHANSFDFILNTVAASHNLDIFSNLLKRDGTLCLVGVPEHPHPSPSVSPLIMRRRNIAGSLIGGTKETQEMLNFCGEHNITSDIEIIAPTYIDEAYERMLRGDVKYRFVVDLKAS